MVWYMVYKYICYSDPILMKFEQHMINILEKK